MKPIILLAFVLASLCSSGQRRANLTPPEEKPAFFSGKWEKTGEKKAVYAVYADPDPAYGFRLRIYQSQGPLVEIRSCSDIAGQYREGPSYFYSRRGELDSVVNFTAGIRNGPAYSLFVRQKGIGWLTRSDWEKGNLIEIADISAADSVLRSRNPLYYFNRCADRLHLIPNPEDVVADSLTGNAADSLEYVGGREGWTRFLQKNLRYPDDAVNNEISGTVFIFLCFDKTGHVDRVLPLISVAHSLDREVEWLYKSAADQVSIRFRDQDVRNYGEGHVSFKLDVSVQVHR